MNQFLKPWRIVEQTTWSVAEQKEIIDPDFCSLVIPYLLDEETDLWGERIIPDLRQKDAGFIIAAHNVVVGTAEMEGHLR